MHKFRLVRLVSILAVLSHPFDTRARQATSPPAPTTSDSQAVALLNQSLNALIGSASASDVKLTGTAERIAGSDDETGTATLTGIPGGYSKLSLNLPSGPRTEIRNPSAIPLTGALPPGTPADVSQLAQPAGAWSGPDGMLHAMANHNVMTDATWFFPAFVLGDLVSSPEYVLSYVGQENLNGRPVQHISASEQLPQGVTEPAPTTQHLTQLDIYINTTNSLPAAIAFNTHPDTNALLDIPVQIEFSNYQTTNGVQVPLHVQRYLNNSLALDLQFTTATLNSGLSANSFQLQ